MAEDYEVQQGDSVSSVAFAKGFFWETVWNDSPNAELKSKRKDPDILMPGDLLHIPDKTAKEQSAATEKKHRFKLKGIPAKLVLCLRRPSKQNDDQADPLPPGDGWDYQEAAVANLADEADADVPYVLYADGIEIAKGTTDGAGRLEAKLPPGAGSGVLVLNRGSAKERTLELNFRHMDPVAELPGVCKRLVNLGFACPTDALVLTPEISAVIASFQQRYALPVTGQADSATQDKLRALHGG